MVITNFLVKHFEEEQKELGTETAIHNLLWTVVASLLKDLGAKNITTSHYPKEGLSTLYMELKKISKKGSLTKKGAL